MSGPDSRPVKWGEKV